jgi:hypothetical protein
MHRTEPDVTAVYPVCERIRLGKRVKYDYFQEHGWRAAAGNSNVRRRKRR